MTAPTAHKTISLTTELLDRLRQHVADGGNASELIERLLRAHFGMAIRPPLNKGRRFPPGESGNPTYRDDYRGEPTWSDAARAPKKP